MPSAKTPPAPGDLHILIVDDEANVREVLHDLVSTLGYRVSLAPSGPEALQLLTRERADMVITDLMMPGMNGWQLVKIIKQRFSDIPVIVLTGYISQEGEEMLTNSQIDGYLVKPVRLSLLNQILERLRNTGKPGGETEITILDDDPAALTAVEEILGRRGYCVTGFREPGDALEHIRTTNPDLVILDLLIPNVNGFDICQMLRDHDATSHIPVLILTAAPSRENVLKALELNVNGFMAKPFAPKELIARVQQALKTPNQFESDA